MWGRWLIIAGVVAAVSGLAGCGGDTAVVTVTVNDQNTAATAPATDPTGDEPLTTLTGDDTGPTDTDQPPATETDGEPPSQTQPPTDARVERPDDFPNGGEAYLLDHLNPDVARHCTREDPDSLSRGAVAGLFCDTTAVFGARAFYDLFPNQDRMDASYGRYREAHDVPPNVGRCIPGRRATFRTPCENSLILNEDPTQVVGRMMVYDEAGETWMIAGLNPLRTLVFLTGPGTREVAGFWFGGAQPRL